MLILFIRLESISHAFNQLEFSVHFVSFGNDYTKAMHKRL